MGESHRKEAHLGAMDYLRIDMEQWVKCGDLVKLQSEKLMGKGYTTRKMNDLISTLFKYAATSREGVEEVLAHLAMMVNSEIEKYQLTHGKIDRTTFYRTEPIMPFGILLPRVLAVVLLVNSADDEIVHVFGGMDELVGLGLIERTPTERVN